MTWGRVASAVRRALSDLLNPDRVLSVERLDTSGPAPITAPPSKPNGPQLSILIARRAQRRANRSRKAAAQYERTNLALLKAVYSEGRE